MLKSLIFSLAILFSSTAFAKDINVIGMVTGAKTGTYIEFGRDIAKIATKKNIKIKVKPSNGSIENIRRITASRENASLGIVQSDVLGFLKRSKNKDSMEIAKKLRMVFPFYKEEVHILAGKNIKVFNDLNGKKVVVGMEGSGNMLTAINLFSLLKIKPAKIIQKAPAEGVVAVLAGEADAVFFIGGKPVTLFKNLENIKTAHGGRNAYLLENVHFLNLNDKRILGEYEAAKITPNDYNFVKEDVNTIAVTSILVTYDFSNNSNPYYKKRCNQLSKIGDAIRENIEYLKKNGHSKWAEVDPNKKLALWKKDKCSWQNYTKNRKIRFNNRLTKDLLSIVKGGK